MIIRVLLLTALSLATAVAHARTAADCAGIQDADRRLACYDQAVGRVPVKTQPVQPPPAPGEPVAVATDSDPTPPDTSAAKRWVLGEDEGGFLDITPYRPNYVLPVTVASSLNRDVYQGGDKQLVEDKVEAKFQISFKTRLADRLFGPLGGDLWFAYTQQAFWQVYNTDFSAPFRETNYEPELLLGFSTDLELAGVRAPYFTVGLSHQSNGRSDPLSRSWNRVTVSGLFERENWAVLARGWWRIPEDSDDDNNPDIEDYMGNGELWTFYRTGDHNLGVMLRNNLDTDDNRGALQVDWSYPLLGPVRGYVQYFYGYGESLISYDHKQHRIGLGFMLSDWY